MEPVFPFNNQASSAAHFATRHVDGALWDAITAKARKISTCAFGNVFLRLKGVGMFSNAKIVLKALIEERYVFFVP